MKYKLIELTPELKKVFLQLFGFAKTKNEDECWIWPGNIDEDGYGYIRHKKVLYLASRLSFMINNPSIVLSLNVLHKCDNPPCVNPKHLVQGTQNDNMKDLYAKKRNNPPKGSQVHLAKLTEEKSKICQK